MKISLRIPEKSDVSAWLKMMQDYYSEDGHSWHEDRQSGAVDMLVQGGVPASAWLIEQDEVLCGYVVLTISFSLETGGMDGFIDELYICPDFRNKGLGGKVLEFVHEEARQQGLKRIYLEVEKGNPAIRLYKRSGYNDHNRSLLSRWL